MLQKDDLLTAVRASVGATKEGKISAVRQIVTSTENSTIPRRDGIESLPAETPLGSAAARDRASTGTSCVSPSATNAARHRAQSSESIPGRPAA